MASKPSICLIASNRRATVLPWKPNENEMKWNETETKTFVKQIKWKKKN